jgi:LmbE family N-acetylglucosaminyl deacetylase
VSRSPARDRDAFARRVLCVAAHADDEVLGIGGTLARHAGLGGEVVTLILSEGEAAKLEETERSPERLASARAAGAAMGSREVLFGHLEDQRFDAVPLIDVIKVIEPVVREFQPEIVYTHHGGDANTDHAIAFKATYASCRPLSGFSRSVGRLLSYETPSSTDQAPGLSRFAFVPNVYVDVESVWDRKVEALHCYPSELVGWPHPRSIEYIEALAVKRGGESGCRKAEAFSLLREVLPARRPG